MTPDMSYYPYSSRRERNVVFFFVMVGISALTYGVCFLVDFLPEEPKPRLEDPAPISAVQIGVPDSATEEETAELGLGGVTQGGDEMSENGNGATPLDPILGQSDALPTLIIFDTLDNREVRVLNPTSASISALDTALLSGVIRHPDSADLAHPGTMFLLGHSSYLPTVHNKNYQAFNGIQKLVWGDTIRIRSAHNEYVYSVDRVYQTKASDASIDIQHDEAKLVLATCNSFATKDDRFVVEASLVDSYRLENGE